MYDLDHLLSRGDAFQNLLSDGPLPDILDEVSDNPEVDVSLEQGHSDLF